MSKVRSSGIGSSAVNFRRIQIEHPEWMNAFNMRNIKGYWYQYQDMEVLGSYLIGQITQQAKETSDEFGLGQPVVFAAPFGGEYNLEEAWQERSKITQIEQLRKFTSDLVEDKRIVGTYCIDTSSTDGKVSGGNHWIAYCLERNSTTGEIRCVYKDSSDRDMKDFEDVIKEAFGGDVSAITGIRGGEGYLPVVPSPVTVGGAGAGSEEAKDGEDKLDVSVIRLDKGNKEQKDGSSCGLFALKNMEILARANIDRMMRASNEGTIEASVSADTADSIPLVREARLEGEIGSSDELAFSFYKPDADELLSLRHYFSDLYVRKVVSGRLEEVLRRNLVDSHKEEAIRLKDKLTGATKFLSEEIASKITKIETIHNPETNAGYLYQIKCVGLSSIPRGVEGLINQLSRNIVDSKDHIRVDYNERSDELLIRFNPEHIKQTAYASSIFVSGSGSATRVQAVVATESRNWREDSDITLRSDQKQTCLKSLVLELRPFGRDDLQILEDVCASNSKIGDEVRGLLIQSEHMGKTFLHVAAESGNVKLLEAMLMAGESANSKWHSERASKTPLELVCERLEVMPQDNAEDIATYKEIIYILVNKGASSEALRELKHKELVAEIRKSEVLSEARKYTDTKVGEVRVDLDKLQVSFEKHLDSIPTGTKALWSREKVREDRLKKIAVDVVKELYSDVVTSEAHEAKFKQRITDCEDIIGSFCKYLQSQIRTTLTGTIAAASGVVSSSNSSSVISKALGAVPYVGFILKAQAELMQNKQSMIWLKEKADHIVSGAQQDSIIADYASFIVDYHSYKIVKDYIAFARKSKESEDSKGSEVKLVGDGLKQAGVVGIKKGALELATESTKEFGGEFVKTESLDNARSALASSIKTISGDAVKSGVKAFVSSAVEIFEDFFFDKRVDDIPAEWKSLGGRYVLDFMMALLNLRIDYKKSDRLGEDIARSILPSWGIADVEEAKDEDAESTYTRISGKSKIDDEAHGFSVKNASTMVELCDLIYRDKEEIERVLGHRWGYKDYSIIGEGEYLAKNLRAIVIKEGNNVIIVLGNNGSSLLKTLDLQEESIDVVTSVNLVSGAVTPGNSKTPITKKVGVHKGFWTVASELWEMEGGLKSLITSYVIQEEMPTVLGEVEAHKELPNIYIAGHSVGGAIAQATYIKVVNMLRDMVIEGGLGIEVDCEIHEKVEIYTYGQPRFLKQSEQNLYVWDELKARYYRVVNDDDIIPQILPSKFVHVGNVYSIGGVKKRGDYEEDVIKRIGGKIISRGEGEVMPGLSDHVGKVFKGMIKGLGKLVSNPSVSNWVSSVTTDPLLSAHDVTGYHSRLDEFVKIEERTKSSVLVEAKDSKTFTQATAGISAHGVTVASGDDDSDMDYESIQHIQVKRKHIVFSDPPGMYIKSRPKDIWEAIKQGNIEAAKEFLDKGWRPKDSSEIERVISIAKNSLQYEILRILAEDERVWIYKGYELHRSIIRGEIDKCKEIMPTVIESIRKSDGIVTMLLELAAWGGHVEIISSLEDLYTYIEQSFSAMDQIGVDVHDSARNLPLDLRDVNGRTALHYAAHGGHVKTIEFIIELKRYINPLLKDKDGNTALHYAARGGHFDSVLHLAPITSGLKIKDQSTIILEAIKGGKVEIVHYLLEQNFKTIADISYTKQMISCAMESFSKNILIFKDMLSFLAREPRSGLNDVYKELILEKTKLFKQLVSKIALSKEDVDFLMLASFLGNDEIIRFLNDDSNKYKVIQTEDAGVIIDVGFVGGRPQYEYTGFIKFDLTSRDKFGRTALHYAAYGGHKDTVKFLVDNDVNPTVKDKDGATALSIALMQGHTDIARFLIVEEGIEPDLEMLEAAIKNNDLELIKILVAEGKVKPTAGMLLSVHEKTGLQFVIDLAKDIDSFDRELIEEYKALVTNVSGFISHDDRMLIVALEDALYMSKAIKVTEDYDKAKVFFDSGVSSLKLREIAEGDEIKHLLQLDLAKIRKSLASTSIDSVVAILKDIQPGYVLLDAEKLIPSVGLGSSIGKLFPPSKRAFSVKHANSTIDRDHPIFSNIHELTKKIEGIAVEVIEEIRKIFLNQEFKASIETAEKFAKASPDYYSKIRKLFDGYEYQHIFTDMFYVGLDEVLHNVMLSICDACHILAVASYSSSEELKAQAKRLESLVNAVWSLNTIFKYYNTYKEKFIEEYGEKYKSKDEFKHKGAKSHFIDEEKYIKKIAKIIEKKKPILGVDFEKVAAISADGDDLETEVRITELSKQGELVEVDLFDEESGTTKRAYLRPESVIGIVAPKSKTEGFGKHPTTEDGERGIFYKFWPYAPGIEFVVNSLNKILLEDISLPTTLVKLIGRGVDNYGKVAIYQASPRINGENFHYLLERPEYVKLIGRGNFSALFLSSLLTGAGDAKPDNFMVKLIHNDAGSVSRVMLISVDNDISFCSGRLGFKNVAGKGKLYSDMANILFFLQQMGESLDGDIAQEIAANPIKPIEIMSKWLESLHHQNKQYEDMIKSGYLTREEADLLKLPIRLPKDSVQKLYARLLDIAKLIEENPLVTPNEIFRYLYPSVAYLYELKRHALGGDLVASIKQIYADAESEEGLASALMKSDNIRSRKLMQAMSSFKEKKPDEFVKLFDTSPEELALEFLEKLDFAEERFVGYEKLLSKIIGDKFKFLEKIKLKNINEEQLELLVDEWIVQKKVADGTNTKKADVMVNEIIIVRDDFMEGASESFKAKIDGSSLKSKLMAIVGRDLSRLVEKPNISQVDDTTEDEPLVYETEVDISDGVLPNELDLLQIKLRSDFVELLELTSLENMDRAISIRIVNLRKSIKKNIELIAKEFEGGVYLLKDMLKQQVKVVRKAIVAESKVEEEGFVEEKEHEETLSAAISQGTDSSTTDLSYKDSLVAMLLEAERKEFSEILVSLINADVIESSDIIIGSGRDRESLLHRLLAHPKWLEYSELINTISMTERFHEHLEARYKGIKLPADIVKNKVQTSGNGQELLAALLNAGGKLTDPTDEEKLMIRGVEFDTYTTSALAEDCYKVTSNLRITHQEIRDGIYDHSKRYKVLNTNTLEETEKSILHFAIEVGDAELFILALESYEIYEINHTTTRDGAKFKKLVKLLPELFELAIDTSRCKARNAEIIEIIYDRIDGDEKPNLYETRDDIHCGEMRLMTKGKPDTIEDLQRYISKLYNMIGWPITIREAIDGIDINKTSTSKNPLTSGNTLLHELIIADTSLFGCIGSELTKENAIKKLLENAKILSLRVSTTDRFDGITPLDLAEEKGLTEIAAILTRLSAQQKLDSKDIDLQFTDGEEFAHTEDRGIDFDAIVQTEIPPCGMEIKHSHTTIFSPPTCENASAKVITTSTVKDVTIDVEARKVDNKDKQKCIKCTIMVIGSIEYEAPILNDNSLLRDITVRKDATLLSSLLQLSAYEQSEIINGYELDLIGV